MVVCYASDLIGREKKLGQQIQDVVVGISLAIGVTSGAYGENSMIFLLCMGREERFRFNLETFAQQQLSFAATTATLKFFNPFRLSVNIAA